MKTTLALLVLSVAICATAFYGVKAFRAARGEPSPQSVSILVLSGKHSEAEYDRFWKAIHESGWNGGMTYMMGVQFRVSPDQANAIRTTLARKHMLNWVEFVPHEPVFQIVNTD